MGQAE